MSKIIPSLIILFFISACADEPEQNINFKWNITGVFQNDTDVSKDHNPFNERYIILNDDSSFESGGRPAGKNTGTYDWDQDLETLVLDSDAGPQDDSKWNIKVKGDTMVWTGYGTEWARQFKLTFLKDQN
ncbi:hypothetical protein GYB22_01345 [bacterium]|nr:hypothetical protein [bacterium]